MNCLNFGRMLRLQHNAILIDLTNNVDNNNILNNCL